MAQKSFSRIRRVVLLLLLSCTPSLVLGEVYILSYQSQVKNSQIIHQSLFASKAMMPHSMQIVETQTVFLTKECSVNNFFHCYESEILDFLLKFDVHIKSEDRIQKLIGRSFSELNIAPQYVEVEFNDTFVKISLLK